jgi:enoyl-CoA hydratase/carnithine racemase
MQKYALVFTGTDPAFSAGMDLGELRTPFDQFKVGQQEMVWDGALKGEQLIERVYRLAKPSVAAVNGVAVGNGAGFLSACDLAVASSSARIG